jgi:hypothetical protein
MEHVGKNGALAKMTWCVLIVVFICLNTTYTKCKNTDDTQHGINPKAKPKMLRGIHPQPHLPHPAASFTQIPGPTKH